MRSAEIRALCIKYFSFISLCHRDFSRAKQLYATNVVSGMESHTLEH